MKFLDSGNKLMNMSQIIFFIECKLLLILDIIYQHTDIVSNIFVCVCTLKHKSIGARFSSQNIGYFAAKTKMCIDA